MRPLILLTSWLALAGPTLGRALQEPDSGRGEPQASVLRLEDLERMAMELNPTIAQADRLIRSAAGRKAQALLYPNPVLGYEAEEFSLKAPGRRSLNYLFLEQRIITGGKRGRYGELLTRGVERAEMQLELQRRRLLNDVRSAFYQALGAQRNVELRRELARISREAVEVSGQLFNIGQSDQPDLLAVEVEAEKAGLDLELAEIDLEKSWAALAAVIGDPELPPATLAGGLELREAPLNPEEALRKLLGGSPEVKLVRGLVEESRARLSLARAQRFPDVVFKGGLGYSQEAREMQALLQIGVSLPLFDRNQGAIASASAELELKELEVKRLELSLRSRFDSAFRDYKKACQRVERYRREIVPRAQKAYDLYLARFREMTASYPQVLISLRTLFQSKSEYVASLVDLRQSLNELEGMLLTGGLRAPEAGMAGSAGAEPEESACLENWRR